MNNLRDAFAWVEHMLAICQRFWGETICEAIADKLATITISTCFSGVGNAETALEAITRGVQHFHSGPSTLPANRWACEWYDESRCELVMLTHAPEHLFSDVTDFLTVRHREALKRWAPMMSYEALAGLFREGSLVSDVAPCVRCGKWCQASSCNVHVAGTPCPAWSAMGTRKYASGPTALPFLVWVFMRRMLQECFILHENVVGFAHEILIELLGDLYLVQSLVINSACLGQYAERPRRYTVLMHRRLFLQQLAGPLINWDEQFVHKFWRTLEATSWRELFTIGSEDEIKAELRWAAARPDSFARSAPVDLDDPSVQFERVLIPNELRRLERYIEMGPVGVCSLQQDPDTRISCNHNRATVHCMIKKNFPTFSVEHHRWMTPLETIATNTVVVNASLSVFGETSSWMRTRESFGLPARKRHAMFEQVGDGMSLPCVGLPMLWFLIQPWKSCAITVLGSSPLLAALADAMARRPRPPPSPRVASEGDEEAGHRRLRRRTGDSSDL